MHRHRLPDDQTILHQLVECLTGIGVGDLIGFIGVQPYLLLATAQDAGRQSLLKPEHQPKGCNFSYFTTTYNVS
uniref:Uncharacterized protein n=1 Tax=Salmo trutta TaxID=8032 RepID=A0A674AEN0_SALTR